MRTISNNEYNELMEFINSKAKDLFEHEVDVAISRNQEPKNVFQGKFSIQQCSAFEKDGKTIYKIDTKRFLNFSRDVIPQLTRKNPNLFRTTDARDILKTLNDISGYTTLNKNPNDYLKYISQEAYIYLVLKSENGFENKVLRIDLCRDIRPTYENHLVYEFQGGLLHVMKHFKLDDALAVDSTPDLEHLVWLCICAFLKIPVNKNETTYTIYIPYDEKHSLLFNFYKEKFTNVFYINTLYPIGKSVMETTNVDGKWGIVNFNGDIVIPCEYDEITLDENADCFFCKRDGEFLNERWDWWQSVSYTGVMDMYSREGKFLIGGFDKYEYNSKMDVFFLQFGGVLKNGSGHSLYKKWIVVDRNMSSLLGYTFLWKKINCLQIPNASLISNLEYINKNKLCNIIDLPEDITFEEYHIINENQIVVRQSDFVDIGSLFNVTPYKLIFVKEKHLSKSCNWFYPITERMAIYEDSKNFKLGIVTSNYMYPARYEYISTPYNDWCIGIAHMSCEPYDSNVSEMGYCALINTKYNNDAPIVFIKGIPYSIIEQYVKNNWIQLCDIDIATTSYKVPNIIIPEELYRLKIVDSLVNPQVQGGASIKSLKQFMRYISLDKLNTDKHKYLKTIFPEERKHSFSGWCSPLEAFEGDESLYNDWLLNS